MSEGERPLKKQRVGDEGSAEETKPASQADGFAAPTGGGGVGSSGAGGSAGGRGSYNNALPTGAAPRGRWDSIGAKSVDSAAAAGGGMMTPIIVGGGAGASAGGSKKLWDVGATPTPRAVMGGSSSNLWDRGQTPSFDANKWAATPQSSTPMGATPISQAWGATPSVGAAGGVGEAERSRFQTVTMTNVDTSMLASMVSSGDSSVAQEFAALSSREQLMVQRIVEAQRYMTDEELDSMLPPGYALVDLAPEMMTRSGDGIDGEQQQGGVVGVDAAVAAAAQQGAGGAAGSSSGGGRIDMPEDGILADDLPAVNVEDIVVFQLLIEYKHLSDSEIPPKQLKRVQVLRSILKFKNGNPKQRRAGTRDLIQRARYYGVENLIQPIVAIWRTEGILQDDIDRHRVVKLLGQLLLQFSGNMPAEQVREVLVLVQPLLHDQDRYTREEGREVMSSLIKAVGLEEMVRAVWSDIDDEREEPRRAAAETIAVVADTLGIEQVLKVIDVMCRSKKGWTTRSTGARVVHEIAISRSGVMCRKYIQQLVDSCLEVLRFDHGRAKSQAALAIGALADAVRPFGYEAFLPTLNLLREEVRSVRGKGMYSFLRAVGSVMVLMPPKEQREQALVLSEVLQRCFTSPDEELRRVALRVVDQCLSCEGVTAEFVQEHLLVGFLNSWSIHAFVEKKSIRQLLTTTGNFAKKVAAPHILATLRERLEQDAPTLAPDHMFVRAVVEGIRIVAESASLVEVLDDDIRTTFDALIETLNRDREGSCFWVELALASFCTQVAATNRLLPLTPKLIRTISARLGDRRLGIRKQASQLLSRTVRIIGEKAPTSLESFRDAWTDLDERVIKDHNPTSTGGGGDGIFGESSGGRYEVTPGSAVAAGLKACTSLLDAWCTTGGRATNVTAVSEAADHVGKLLPAIQAALKAPQFKHDDGVQEQCVRSVLAVVALSEQEIAVASPEDLFNIAVESLLLLLGARRRQTRTLTAQAFGRVANLIGPLHIIKKLIEKGLRRDDKAYRLCAGIALAVVAKSCRPFVVVPFLVFEYEQSKGTELAITIQHAVLKCVRFLFEHIAGEPDAVPCVHAVLPLIERALTERQLQHRRMACEAVRQMMLACAGGVDVEATMRPVWVHLLNFVVPSVLEPVTGGKEQRKAISTVVEVLEAARLVLPPAQVQQFLMQGMFHPARFVRDVYWNTYNLLAIGAGEALVACAPAIEDTAKNTYRRHLLETIV